MGEKQGITRRAAGGGRWKVHKQLRLYRRGRDLPRQANGARGEGTPKPQP